MSNIDGTTGFGLPAGFQARPVETNPLPRKFVEAFAARTQAAETQSRQPEAGSVEGARAFANDPARIREAAEGFEEVLLQKLLDEMQKTIPDGGLFNDSTTRQVQSLFNMMLAKHVASSGGIGLADQLYGDFCRMANLSAEPQSELELER
jgi:hypothetical protein